MSGRLPSWRAAAAAALALVLALTLGTPAASAAGRDRTPPTRPTNLRATATTPFSVSLAWTRSSDNSGSFSYRVRHSYGYEAVVPQTQTSFTWTSNLEPGYTYSFYVYAVDAAGNRSTASNTVTVLLPADRTPPTAPALSIADVGPTYVSLTWTASIEDGPHVWYQVFLDGSPAVFAGTSTSTTVLGLSPSTTYSFSVQARDNGINWSEPSNAVSTTTEPSSPNDTSPPTPPGNLSGFDGGCGEAWLSWNQSTDDADPQFAIRYEVSVNGVLRPESTTIGSGRTVAYAAVEGSNTFEVVAVDGAGNRSAPASVTLRMFGLCQ